MKTLYIVNAKVVDNLSVLLYFNDNTRQVVDIGSYIHNHPHPQYNKYLNPRQFAKFKIENGNIVWGDDWDLIFPMENLYRGKAENNGTA
jgi:subtilase family serine protease